MIIHKKLNLHDYLPFDNQCCIKLIKDFKHQFRQIYMDKKHFYENNQDNLTFIDCLINLPKANSDLEIRIRSYLLKTFYVTTLNNNNEFNLLVQNKINDYFKNCYDNFRQSPNQINYIEKILLSYENEEPINNSLITSIIKEYVFQFKDSWQYLPEFYGTFYLLNQVQLLKQNKKISHSNYENFSFLFYNILYESKTFINAEGRQFFIDLTSNYVLFPNDFTSEKYDGYLSDIFVIDILNPTIEQYLISNKITTNYETLKANLSLKQDISVKKQKI